MQLKEGVFPFYSVLSQVLLLSNKNPCFAANIFIRLIGSQIHLLIDQVLSRREGLGVLRQDTSGSYLRSSEPPFRDRSFSTSKSFLISGI